MSIFFLNKNLYFDLLGKFCFLNKNGRIEKTVEAHRGATICVRWSPDGSQFATGCCCLNSLAFILLFDNLFLGGEDGQVRIWARSGMLRSNLVQSGKS